MHVLAPIPTEIRTSKFSTRKLEDGDWVTGKHAFRNASCCSTGLRINFQKFSGAL